ncbi:NACHT domain-containing protein [Actinocorallia longicatena]|uniref:NACHT domain-containing protein n=1 Tax=Actinocorallia longicatena TaxID=111803 RepID=A0ABP6QHI9_9ACTN
MTRLRKASMIVTTAGLAVAVGVATNQVLNGDVLSWTWAYVAFGLAVIAAVVASVATEPESTRDRPVRFARRAYLRQLHEVVRFVDTVGIATSSEFTPLMRHVYVDVALRRRPVQDAAHAEFVGREQGTVERRKLESFFGEGRVLAVLGGPGSGKTTMVRHTALSLCSGRGRLPILVYLRDHAALILGDEPAELEDVAVAAAWLDGRVPAAWVRGELDHGRCVVLLDGLDEVSDEAGRKRVSRWVNRQIQRYPGNDFVLTSRPHGYQANPVPAAEVLQVQRFTGEQISEFLRYWYYEMKSRGLNERGPSVRAVSDREAADLLDRIRAQSSLYDLASNPLLLTMIANVHRYRGKLPGSRAELYAEMCDVLIHRRQEAKDLTDATGLRGSQKVRVIRHLALHMMRGELKSITFGAARSAVRQRLRQVSADVTPEVFLDEIRKSGLLVEREYGHYAFAHLTLQEYLAAAQIREQPGPHLRHLVGNVNDPWWRETTLLWAADSDATPVIEACLSADTVRALALAFDCADESSEIDPHVRDHLNAILAQTDSVSDERRRLVLGVHATRALKDVITLGNGTTICTAPVSVHLYDLFRTDVLRHSGLRMRELPSSGGAVVGAAPQERARFLDWLNRLSDDERFGLPSTDDLSDPDAASITALCEHPVWTREGLWTKSSVDWPFEEPAAWPAVFSAALFTETVTELQLGVRAVAAPSRHGVAMIVLAVLEDADHAHPWSRARNALTTLSLCSAAMEALHHTRSIHARAGAAYGYQIEAIQQAIDLISDRLDPGPELDAAATLLSRFTAPTAARSDPETLAEAAALEPSLVGLASEALRELDGPESPPLVTSQARGHDAESLAGLMRARYFAFIEAFTGRHLPILSEFGTPHPTNRPAAHSLLASFGFRDDDWLEPYPESVEPVAIVQKRGRSLQHHYRLNTRGPLPGPLVAAHFVLVEAWDVSGPGRAERKLPGPAYEGFLRTRPSSSPFRTVVRVPADPLLELDLLAGAEDGRTHFWQVLTEFRERTRADLAWALNDAWEAPQKDRQARILSSACVELLAMAEMFDVPMLAAVAHSLGLHRQDSGRVPNEVIMLVRG